MHGCWVSHRDCSGAESYTRQVVSSVGVIRDIRGLFTVSAQAEVYPARTRSIEVLTRCGTKFAGTVGLRYYSTAVALAARGTSNHT